MTLISDAIARDVDRIAAALRQAAPARPAGALRRSISTGVQQDTETGQFYIPVSQAPRPHPRPLKRGRIVDFGITGEEAAVSLKAALGGCPHKDPQPVTLCTGEVVAAVCPTCLDALPASFVGSDWKP